MNPPDDHQRIEIESFENSGANSRGKVGLRPIAGQKFPVNMAIEGNKSLVVDYPVGTRFKVQVSLMKRETGAAYLFSSWQWDVQVVDQPEAN